MKRLTIILVLFSLSTTLNAQFLTYAYRKIFIRDSLYNIGINQFDNNIDEAVRNITKAATMGHVAAHSTLGEYYWHLGSEEDEYHYKESFKWFQKGHELGSLYATVWLGVLYDNGQGVKEDKEKAINLYLRGAHHGDEMASLRLELLKDVIIENANRRNATYQLFLAVMYDGGYGIQKNQQEAISWYKKSADNGNSIAIERLKERHPPSTYSLLPIWGIDFNTSEAELARMGYKEKEEEKSYKNLCDYTYKFENVWVQVKNGKVINIIIGLDHKLPINLQTLGFDETMSYNQWVKKLSGLGYTITTQFDRPTIEYNSESCKDYFTARFYTENPNTGYRIYCAFSGSGVSGIDVPIGRPYISIMKIEKALAGYSNDDKKNDSDFSGESGTFTDPRDGVVYKWVRIGTQIWMAENLKATKYNNGTSIPNVTDQDAWDNLTIGAWCDYTNDASKGKAYGKLYNWYAVNTGELAPQGWHVPTNAEWDILADYLGGENVAGDKMKSTSGWNNKGNGSDSSGFSGSPGGFRYYGGFYGVGYYGLWWSSTPGDTYDVWRRSLGYNFSYLTKLNIGRSNGFSVRCVRD